MRIGLLQAGHLPDEIRAVRGDYDRVYAGLFDGLGLDWTAYPVCDGIFPDGPGDHDGWLISGSRHGAYDDLPWIPRLETFIRAAWEARVPIAGICFGHQIIAQALGGRVEKFDGGWAVGRHEYDWSGAPVTLNAWHQDQVVDAPDSATVVATSPFCRNAAFLYADARGPRAFSLQPHPEFDADLTRRLLETRAPGVVPDALIRAAMGTLDAPTDDRRMAGQIAGFFADARATGAARPAPEQETTHG